MVHKCAITTVRLELTTEPLVNEVNSGEKTKFVETLTKRSNFIFNFMV